MTPALTTVLPAIPRAMSAATSPETARLASGTVDAAFVWSVLAVGMAAGAAATAVGIWHEERTLSRRRRRVAGAEPQVPRGRRTTRAAVRVEQVGRLVRRERAESRGPRRLVSVTAAAVIPLVTVALCGGDPTGWFGGTVAGLLAWRLQRRPVGADTSPADASPPDGAHRVERQLPLTVDLLGACLTAGASPARAADAVGCAVGGRVGSRLVRAAAELRLGAEPASVWGAFGTLPGCRQLARCMERAGTSGAPPAQSVARLAAEYRAQHSRAAAERAKRVAVQVTGPLGLCFLPAFLAMGVAPVILGLARSLL